MQSSSELNLITFFIIKSYLTQEHAVAYGLCSCLLPVAYKVYMEQSNSLEIVKEIVSSLCLIGSFDSLYVSNTLAMFVKFP